MNEVDCQIVLNAAWLFRRAGLLDQASVMYKNAAQGLLALLGPKHSKYVAAQEQFKLFDDLCDIRRELEERTEQTLRGTPLQPQ